MLVLKSDTRYYSNGPTEGMFTHKDFKDTTVQLFVRVGSSKWVKFSEQVDVVRRIGARSVQDELPSPSPSPSPRRRPGRADGGAARPPVRGPGGGTHSPAAAARLHRLR